MTIPFITYREENENKQLEYFILQKDFPHFLGKITANPYEVSILKVPISGYKLYVSYQGCLRGKVMPAYNGVEQDILVAFQKMADWYKENRILIDEKRYKKFKL